jgi:hypothetical protein
VSTEIPPTVDVGEVSSWSDEVGVLVIGFGIAGGCAFKWLEGLGFQFERSFYPGKVVVPPTDRTPFARDERAGLYRNRGVSPY